MSIASARSSRLERLSQILQINDVDAYLCTSGVTMGYLSGFHEEGGERLLTFAVHKSGRSRMVCPALSRAQAERCGFQDIRAWKDGEDPWRLVEELASDWAMTGGRIAVDDEMRSSILLVLQGALPTAEFFAGQPVLSQLMRVKDASELALLKRAGAAADDSLAPTLAKIRPGTTEWEVHEWLSAEMRSRDSLPNFCIVATGKHGAEPHHGTDQTAISKGDVVVMDYGCSVGGYMSDITRTVVIGEPTAEQSRVYDTVFHAHMAAREAIRPGVLAEDIDKAARAVIEKAGYGEFFIHRTGHGLGMRIHEEPYICSGNQHRFEVGNVFSIEPGIYLPGQFGVRIENIVAVTENGHESMNAEPSPQITVVPV